jgi:hypothetical protein
MHDLTDTDFWNDPVELVMPLFIAMAVHGHLCLALRHPGTQHTTLRPAVVRAVRRLGDLLVDRGALTKDELALLERVEAEEGGLSPDEPGWPGGALVRLEQVMQETSRRAYDAIILGTHDPAVAEDSGRGTPVGHV